MGTWDIGPFENDTALDWIEDFRESDSPVDELDSALELILGNGERSNSSAESVVLAASEIVAALIGHERQDLPDHVLRTIDELPDIRATRLVALKRKALRAVTQLDGTSELRHLWKEAQLESEWEQTIEDLVERLNASMRKVRRDPQRESPPAEAGEPRPGALFEIPISSGKRGFGQIISVSPFYLEVVFEPLFGIDAPPPDNVTGLTQLFVAVTSGELTSDGGLQVVSRTTPTSVPLPYYRTTRGGSLCVECFSKEEAYPIPHGLSRYLRSRSNVSESRLKRAFMAYHGDTKWAEYFDELLSVEWYEYAEKSREVFEKAKEAALSSQE